jgi:uncharacterized protein (TIGR02145 family)
MINNTKKMKCIKFYFLITVLLAGFGLSAQVAINTDGSAPDSSAILDLQNSDKGFLPPRMTVVQRNAINNPAIGLIVYNTITNRPNIYNGTEWRSFSGKWADCGLPITYEGQIYNTVSIGNQCWIKENLNVGTRIDVSDEQTDNNVIEKYCYDDDETNCDTYGGLYQWYEITKHKHLTDFKVGGQGICPDGWHIPTQAEWTTLDGMADTQYLVGDQEWNSTGYRGYNAGKHLKSTISWDLNNGTDTIGFSGLPGGRSRPTGIFSFKENQGVWWSSTFEKVVWPPSIIEIMIHKIESNNNKASLTNSVDMHGFSVRCVREQ